MIIAIVATLLLLLLIIVIVVVVVIRRFKHCGLFVIAVNDIPIVIVTGWQNGRCLGATVLIEPTCSNATAAVELFGLPPSTH